MMKLKRLFIGMLIICLACVSCSKEKEKELKFTFNNIDRPVDHAYIMHGGSSATQSLHHVYICTPGITFSSSGLDGFGDFIYMYFLSDSPDELISGTYSYSATLTSGTVLIGYDDILGEYLEYDLDTGGESEATIVVSGETYEIEFSLALETDKTLTGYYKGTLEEVSIPMKSAPVTLSQQSE